MKQLHIYLFFISMVVPFLVQSQEDKKISARDTLPPGEKYGIRVGVDISRLARGFYNEDYKGFEIVGDYRVYRRFYAAIELGNESFTRDEENINVSGSGNYIRIGFDYNAYKNWYGMQNSIVTGLRYGFSTFDQELISYNIFTSTNYFPSEVREMPMTSSDLNGSWIEFVFGLKVELFNNLYLGATVAIRNMISEKTPDRFDNLFIPGFGRTNDFGNFGIGYNYSISYLIPFYKKKR